MPAPTNTADGDNRFHTSRLLGNGVIFVTGAAGFIGSHLSERLVAGGSRVVGVDNFCDFYDPTLKRRNLQSLLQSPRFTLIEADIRDGDRMDQVVREARPSVIVHLAAMVGVRPSLEVPSLYASVNVGGTVSLLQAAARHGVRRFVLASSSSVYGNSRKVPFSEEDPVDHPISPYAATKRASELLGHAFAHVHGLSVICLRYFTVFGPRQRPDLAIAKFMARMARGQEIPVFGDGSSSRDYTYVDDIVSGTMAAIQRPDPFRIYNLGGSSPVTLSTLVETIERVTGLRARIRRLPAQPGDVERTCADIARAREELQYRPTVGLEEGIARQWEWFRSSQGPGE